jgi:hypothetical protein
VSDNVEQRFQTDIYSSYVLKVHCGYHIYPSLFSSCKAVGSTVEIWYCCSTEKFVWRIICSYRFGTVIILREVELHHSFQNNLTYIKEVHTLLQSNNKVRTNGTWPKVCKHMDAKLKCTDLKYLNYLILHILCII